MKVHETANIRNVALVGHGGAGKTALTSALLYAARATEHLGSVTEGTTVTDFDEDEIERKFSMSLAAAFAEWRDHKLNLIDSPGHSSFVGDSAAALRGADALLIVVDAVEGIGVQTERMWDEAERLSLPVLFAATQIDRDRADAGKTVNAIVARFGRQVVPISTPFSADGAWGIVRLVSGRAQVPKSGSPDVDTVDVPASVADEVKEAQEKLFDLVAESDDSLMEAFLEQGSLNETQLKGGLCKAIASRSLFPVFSVSATTLAGVHGLLDALVDYAPTPADRPALTGTREDGEEVEVTVKSDLPFVAQVIKTYIDPFAGRISLLRVYSGGCNAEQTVWNASTESNEKLSHLSAPRGKQGEIISAARAGDVVSVTKLKETQTGHTLVADKQHSLLLPDIPFPRPVIAYAVMPDGSGNDEKVSAALHKLAEEDATLQMERDPRSHELMLKGLGASHVKIILERMHKRYGVSATLEKPKVPYLETITKKAQTSYRHKKQSGGAGQFAEVHMRIEPLARGAGFEYDSEVFGGSISRNFWPSIEKGVKQVLNSGAIAGYPMVDIKAVIFDGKEHPVDSKDIAFQIAGRNVFREAVQAAGPVVLEPIMKVVVTCPDESMGDVLGDLNRRRGRVLGSTGQSGRATIEAEVPMAEMLEYSATLRSVTSGAGSYTMELDHYDRVPADIQKTLREEFKPQVSED
ncbi:MAG: elongation factor G [Acidobacteriota bacterium]|nr:elongation factor G [Acidobacteriota bacterium]